MKARLVALALATLLGCQPTEGRRIPLPPSVSGGDFFARVAGASASDVWWPGCDREAGTLRFSRYSGGWTEVPTDAACFDPGDRIASFKTGTILVSDGQRLLFVEANGEVTEAALPTSGAPWAILAVSARDSAAWALLRNSLGTAMIVEWDGDAFVEVPGIPNESLSAARLLAMGPDDLWVLPEPQPVSWMDGYSPSQHAWHYDGERWLDYGLERGAASAFSVASDPDDIWMMRDNQGNATLLQLSHFDGSSWSSLAIEAPVYDPTGNITTGSAIGVYPAPRGGFRLLGSYSASSGPSNTGLYTELAYSWTGDGWDEGTEVTTIATLACSTPPCGAHVSGDLADGTTVRNRATYQGKTQLVLWRP